jgi:alkylresorcinol/alkylpyrone synthase
MPVLAGLHKATPPHVLSQADIKPFVSALFRESLGADAPRLGQIFDTSGIRTRHVAMPLAWFERDWSFAEKNACYVEAALELAAAAVKGCLARAGLAAADVDHVVVASTTGLSTPSLEARLANRVGFRADCKRTPLWGLGCAGGAAGLGRAADFARADPDARVLFVALELCSLTFQRNDLSRENFVATALFGDGAAAVLVVGDRAARGLNGGGPLGPERASPRLSVDAAESRLRPDSLGVMGWDVNDAGLKVVFSRDIPRLVREWVGPHLAEFLAARGLGFGDVAHLAFHPGGPKVLASYEEELDIEPASLDAARGVLAEFGNMSSPTCLFVLERLLERGVAPGERILMAAVGPGFAAEMVLLSALNP